MYLKTIGQTIGFSKSGLNSIQPYEHVEDWFLLYHFVSFSNAFNVLTILAATSDVAGYSDEKQDTIRVTSLHSTCLLWHMKTRTPRPLCNFVAYFELRQPFVYAIYAIHAIDYDAIFMVFHLKLCMVVSRSRDQHCKHIYLHL